jgi:L-aspartate oxidase
MGTNTTSSSSEQPTNSPQDFDILIIGSGVAALSMALKISDDKTVCLLTKESIPDTNSAMAQGGIASVSEASDSFESHIKDTLIAGAGLCKIEAVRNIIEQAPNRIQDLLKWGVEFDSDLTREGGHSHRRILHFEDQTGAEIHKKLWLSVQKKQNIHVFENHFAIDLIVNKQVDPNLIGPTAALGVYALDKKNDRVEIFTARTTILATGGAGKVYLYTSNWSGATGDGIAMAYRAGCRVSNLEFMQFHPTCLYHKDSRNFLITEAIRGEGGELINSKGEAFMKKHHHLGSLAPRDIVARGIDAEMKKTGADCVYLDITHKPIEFIKAHFPTIYSKCLEYGIDMSKQPIPVVPAAHYLCGGIVTDTNGKTDIAGLFAIGEVANTGLHGANRLASNSLLECLAMSHNASLEIEKNWPLHLTNKLQNQSPKPWKKPDNTNTDEMIVISHMWEEIRRLMWNYVGIVRSTKRLERAKHRLQNITQEVKEYYSNMKIHSDIIELRNISIVADLTVQCALKRKESRGIHYSLDFPPANEDFETDLVDQCTTAHDSILLRGLS